MIRTFLRSLHLERVSAKTSSLVRRTRIVPTRRPPSSDVLSDTCAVFVDAPHVLEPVDLTGHGATLDAFGAHEASVTSEDPALKPRCWWRSDPTRTRTDGLEESLAFLRDILRTERFEVRASLAAAKT